MISFYPGPSKIYPQVKDYMTEACDSGVLSLNHRSTEFVSLSKETIGLLKEKLDIPANYSVFFTSSATECWEVLAQSYISLYSYHIYNGAFGEKWLDYRKKICPNASGESFSEHASISLNKLNVPQQTEVLCLTQNETSNGTQVKNRIITNLRKRFDKALLCVDATSSMGGIVLPWKSGDIWFASVQKCFGLPAGLAIMVCSPNAVRKANVLNHNQHYNSLPFMIEKMGNWQTTHTPNVLNIFLLNRVLKQVPHIKKIHQSLKKRKEWFAKLMNEKRWRNISNNKNVLADTVFAIKEAPEKVKEIKSKLLKAGLLAGNGYGKWKDSSFRIANFPALNENDWDELEEALKKIK